MGIDVCRHRDDVTLDLIRLNNVGIQFKESMFPE